VTIPAGLTATRQWPPFPWPAWSRLGPGPVTQPASGGARRGAAARRTPSAGTRRGSGCTRPGRVPCPGRARPLATIAARTPHEPARAARHSRETFHSYGFVAFISLHNAMK
jgi:hypothetical protein